MTTTPFDGAASALQSDLLDVATVVLPLAAGVAIIPIGWRWVRRFIK